MLDIKYSRLAVKYLKSLDKKLVLRILQKIEKLYKVDYKNNLLGIVKIEKRAKAY